MLYVLPADAKLKREQATLVTASGQRYEFTIEVAESEQDKAMGLMFRTAIGEREGMLFPYPESREITMWMKNTYIPLDMVFVKGDGTIHRIEARTEPFSEKVIASRGNVTAVLEIAGGLAEKLGVKAGDRIVHRLFKP